MKGVLAGILGCVFGIIGIFAFAIVFVPLAGICAIVGLIRGIVGKSAAGIGTSLLAGVLSVVGYLLSPTLLLITAGLITAGLSLNSLPQPVSPAIPYNVPSTNQRSGFTMVPGSAQALAHAEAEARAAIIECRNKRLAGELQNYLASAICSNSQIIRVYQQSGYRYMDLIYALTAKRSEVSMALDNQKITESQANEIITKYMNFLTGVAQQRDRNYTNKNRN